MRPHANSFDPAMHTAASESRGRNTADCLQEGDNRVDFFYKRLTIHFSKPNIISKHYMHEGTCQKLLLPAPRIQEGRCTKATLGATAQIGIWTSAPQRTHGKVLEDLRTPGRLL